NEFGFEPLDDRVPRDGQRGGASIRAGVGPSRPTLHYLTRHRDESLSIAERGHETIFAVANKLPCRRVVVAQHDQSARHRLGDDVAKGLGRARKNEYIRRGVVIRQLFSAMGSGVMEI